jgi:hypothetical protein
MDIEVDRYKLAHTELTENVIAALKKLAGQSAQVSPSR